MSAYNITTFFQAGRSARLVLAKFCHWNAVCWSESVTTPLEGFSSSATKYIVSSFMISKGSNLTPITIRTPKCTLLQKLSWTFICLGFNPVCALVWRIPDSRKPSSCLTRPFGRVQLFALRSRNSGTFVVPCFHLQSIKPLVNRPVLLTRHSKHGQQ